MSVSASVGSAASFGASMSSSQTKKYNHIEESSNTKVGNILSNKITSKYVVQDWKYWQRPSCKWRCKAVGKQYKGHPDASLHCHWANHKNTSLNIPWKGILIFFSKSSLLIQFYQDHIGHLDQLNTIFQGQIVQLCKDLTIGVDSHCDDLLTNWDRPCFWKKK